MQKVARILLILMMMMIPLNYPVWGESNIAQIKEHVAEALKNNYWGEYTETVFRFGRRQETTYQVWVKNRNLLKQVQTPLWQRGELSYDTDKLSLFYISGQNAGLKIEIPDGKNKKRFPEWQSWLDRVSLQENDTLLYGRPVYVLSGIAGNFNYRLYIDKESHFPTGFDLYRQEILNRSYRFLQVKKLPSNFNPESLFPENVKWYDNSNKFWQTVSLARTQQGVNFPITLPTYLPEGYVFSKASLEELSFATVAHLLFEGPNGQKLSVFEREKLSEKQQFSSDSVKDFNKPNQTITLYQWFSNQVHFAMIGSVSFDELKKIAASFEKNPNLK